MTAVGPRRPGKRQSPARHRVQADDGRGRGGSGRETHRPGKLSFAQYRLLFGLAEHDELSGGELAVAADLSPATVTQLLDALAELGLVTRSRSEHDRRIVTCSLTDVGREAVAKRRAKFERIWKKAVADLEPSELANRGRGFERIGTMFEGLTAGSASNGRAAGTRQRQEVELDRVEAGAEAKALFTEVALGADMPDFLR